MKEMISRMMYVFNTRKKIHIYKIFRKEYVSALGETIPACVFQIYQHNGLTNDGVPYIAICERRYTTKETIIKGVPIIDDFKGHREEPQYFYSPTSLLNFLEQLSDENAIFVSKVRSKENKLAGCIFEFLILVDSCKNGYDFEDLKRGHMLRADSLCLDC